MARATQRGPVTAKVCVLAKALRNTQFVKSAAPDPQQNQALRPSFPRAPGRRSVKRSDRRPEHRTATTACKLLINLTFMADGHFAHVRGHRASHCAPRSTAGSGEGTRIQRAFTDHE